MPLRTIAEGQPDASKENARKPPGSRSLIRHRLFLQQNLHLNPNGVWLNPCGMRLYIASKSPLFIKYTLQLRYSRYPHFCQVSPPMQLECGTVQLPGKSLFLCSHLVAARAALICSHGGLGMATRCPWEKAAKLPRKTGNRDCNVSGSGIVGDCCRACGEMQSQSLGLQRGEGNTPQEGAGYYLGPEGCSALKVGPS